MPNFLDPFLSGGLDPVGMQGIVPSAGAAPPMVDPAMQQMMNQPVTGLPQVAPMLQQPTMSERLINAGLAMIAADEAGLGLGGSLASGMKAYNKTLEDHSEKQRKERRESLAEWEIMGRIKERQMTEQQMAKRATMIERLKKENPDLADLIELDPETAAKTIASNLTPKTPFEGTGMDAQVNNILLVGDPASSEYLAAYNIAKQPKTQVNPQDGSLITIVPDMSAYRPPAIIQGVGGAGAAPVAAASPVGGSTTQNIGGTTLVTSAPTKKAPLTEVAAKAVYAASRMENAENLLSGLPQGAETAGTGGVNAAASAVSAIPSMGLGDAVGEGIRMFGYSSDEKKYRNLANEWNDARLRQESGAVVGKEELEKGFKQFFPQPNDDAGVIAQKAALRANAMKAMKGIAESNQSKPLDPIAATPTGSPADALGVGGGGGMLDDAAQAPAMPKTAADFANLSSGSLYINPKDGKTYRKK